MRIAENKEYVSISHKSSRDRRNKSLIWQSALLVLSVAVYAKIGNLLSLGIMVYFGVNACCILLVILVSALWNKKEAPAEVVVLEKKTKTEKTAEKPSEAGKEPVKRLDLNFQLSFRKKNKTIVPPKQIVIKKYAEYAPEFKLTKALEKEFKQWILDNALARALTNQPQMNMGKKTQKTLSRTEINDLRMMSGNGFMCYDKNNELHGRALFKVLYNYFNENIPGDSSYYINPMDEFVFDDISKVKISRFGLLVEDTESLIERKKTFSVYFMNKNILYDTHGDVILSFLLLLMFANENEGRSLGALSLRNLPFLVR